MADTAPPREEFPDEMPHAAATDSLLSLEGRTPGPRGVGPKLGLAAIALLVLLGLVIGALLLSHFSPTPNAARQDSQVQTR